MFIKWLIYIVDNPQLVSISVVAVPFALWPMLFTRFPKIVAIHYDLNNNVDGYGDPNFLLLTLGIIEIGFIIMFYIFRLVAGVEIGRVRSINLVGVLLVTIFSGIMCNYIFTWSFGS